MTYISLSLYDIPEFVVPIKISLIELRLTRKLPNQGTAESRQFRYILASRIHHKKFYGHQHDLVNRYRISVSQITTDMFHLSYSQLGIFPHSPLITGFAINKSNMTDTTGWAGTAYLQFLVWFVFPNFLFVVFCRSLFVLCLLAILLSVLDLHLQITTLVSSNFSS